MAHNDEGDRRDFLGKLTGAVGVVIGGAVAVPGAVFLAHPLIEDTIGVSAGESRLGPVDGFEVGVPQKVSITADRRDAWVTTRGVTIGSVWVVRAKAEPAEFRVLSSICPHLGCAVNKAEEGFICPCHRSRFDVDGAKVEEGEETNPSPRPMDALEHVVRDGVLYCTFERFKSGVVEKVPA